MHDVRVGGAPDVSHIEECIAIHFRTYRPEWLKIYQVWRHRCEASLALPCGIPNPCGVLKVYHQTCGFWWRNHYMCDVPYLLEISLLSDSFSIVDHVDCFWRSFLPPSQYSSYLSDPVRWEDHRVGGRGGFEGGALGPPWGIRGGEITLHGGSRVAPW